MELQRHLGLDADELAHPLPPLDHHAILAIPLL